MPGTSDSVVPESQLRDPSYQSISSLHPVYLRQTRHRSVTEGFSFFASRDWAWRMVFINHP